MKMIKRISLFLIVNLLVLVTLGVSTSLLGVNQYLTQNGLNIGSLLVYAMIFGFAGATISLFLSKPLAKWSMGVKIIESGGGNSDERWLYQLVERYSQKLNINMPEVGIYDSAEMNAFATGASKNSSLVAVSTGLLGSMKKDEIEAVICHELGHVANGDMVTMTLIQGVINTFVIFLSRVIGYVVDKVVLKNENGSGIGYTITVLVLDIVLGIAASIVVATFSRYREYHADAASARLMGGPGSMIKALEVLGAGAARGELPQNIRAFGINGSGEGWLSLFSTHPSIEKRIAALRSGAYNN